MQHDVMQTNKIKSTFLSEEFHTNHFAVYMKSMLHDQNMDFAFCLGSRPVYRWSSNVILQGKS